MCFLFCFGSLIGIPVSITNSAKAIKICVVISGIKRYKSIIEKKKKKYDTTELLAKTRLSTIEFLICNALINSNSTLECLIEGWLE